MGIQIFLHALRLVLDNWRAALRISGPLLLLIGLPSIVFPFFVLRQVQPENYAAILGLLLALSPLAMVSGVIILPWIAVGWHRFILLDEVPTGLFPKFSARRIFAYFGYSLVIGMLAMMAASVVGGISALVLAPLLHAVGGVIAGILAIGVALVITYRMAPILPEVALDRTTSLGGSFRSSTISIGTILVLALVSAIAEYLVDLPTTVLIGLPGVGMLLASLWQLATWWLKLLVGVSIITTLYGHYVEGRPLPAK